MGCQEAGSLSGFAEGAGFGWDDFVVPSKAAVVEALAEQDYVCYRVVDCEDDHRGQNSLEHCAENVEDITGEPDDNELE